MNTRQLAQLVATEARRQGVPIALALGLVEHESAWNPGARGEAGEIGLFQIMPRYWDRWARSHGWNIRDIRGNIATGIAILKGALRAEGSIEGALRRYNGGPGWRNKPVTKNYANAVLAAAKRYSKTSVGAGGQGGSFPVVGGKVISRFGDERDGGARKHQGVDIAAPKGTPVTAFQGGTVTRVVTSDNGRGYGRVVYVRGADGREYRYAHLNTVGVRVGQKLGAGQQLGTVGTSGNARTTPPHLHFEVRENGKPLNPEPILSGALEIGQSERTRRMAASRGTQAEAFSIEAELGDELEAAQQNVARTIAKRFGVDEQLLMPHVSAISATILKTVEARSQNLADEAAGRQTISELREPETGLADALSIAAQMLGGPPDGIT